ncbi:MAG: hypothetical protein PSV22_12030 [Pseudolabrys sp.]|nr:hypothetical protein [Pseudolabrys sp.]
MSDEIRAKIEAVAASRNQSVGSLVELILRDWLEANGKPPKKPARA